MYPLYFCFRVTFLFIQPYEIHGIGERDTGVGNKGKDSANIWQGR